MRYGKPLTIPTAASCILLLVLALPAAAPAASFAQRYHLRTCPEPVLGADGSALRYARTERISCKRARKIIFKLVDHGKPHAKGYGWQLPHSAKHAPRVFDGRLRSKFIAPDGFRPRGSRGAKIAVAVYSHRKGFGTWSRCDRYVLEASGETALKVTNNSTCQVERVVLHDYAAAAPAPGESMQMPGNLTGFVCTHKLDASVACVGGEGGGGRVDFHVETYD